MQKILALPDIYALRVFFQGHQADLVILTTIRPCSILDDDSTALDFFHNDARITSRPCHSFCNCRFSIIFPNWVLKSVLTIAVNNMPIVLLAYVDSMASDATPGLLLVDDKGVLLAPGGYFLVPDLATSQVQPILFFIDLASGWEI